MSKKRTKHKRNTNKGSWFSTISSIMILGFLAIVYTNSPRNNAVTQDTNQSFQDMIERVTSISTAKAEVPVDPKEVQCLAKNIFFEARGTSWDEMVRVANVTMNRVESGNYPDSVCDTVYQYKQFSWTLVKSNTIKRIKQLVARSDEERDQWDTSQQIARLAISKQLPDRTHGAMAYHAVYIEKPKSDFWKHCVRLASTDFHVYYKY